MSLRLRLRWELRCQLQAEGFLPRSLTSWRGRASPMESESSMQTKHADPPGLRWDLFLLAKGCRAATSVPWLHAALHLCPLAMSQPTLDSPHHICHSGSLNQNSFSDSALTQNPSHLILLQASLRLPLPFPASEQSVGLQAHSADICKHL